MTETELMQNLVVGYTETGGGKLKKGNGFLEPNLEVLPKVDLWGVRYDEYVGLICVFWVVAGCGFIENYKEFTHRCIVRSGAKGDVPRGNKLNTYPSYSTYSTRVMWCMGLGSRVGDGFVECDGLQLG